MKLACYCRYSSDNQREESIDAQLRAIYSWAKSNSHTISVEYVDRALSGKTDNRPEFMKMINASDKNLWDGIVVHKIDRFSRDKYDSVFYKKKLKDNGKKFFSVAENISDDPSSIIMESLLEGMAQYYVMNLSREVKKGLDENAYNCKYNGGTPPLGYNIGSDRKCIINEYEAQIVRDIFKLYLSGNGLLKIAIILNERGYKTKRGNKFGKNSLYDILGNERYTGMYIFNQSIKSNKRVKNENIIKIDGGMPQIISKEDFKKVMEKRENNKGNQGNYKANTCYLLSGLIKCGKCGRNYIGHTSVRKFTTKDSKVSWYQCSGRNKLDNCININVRQDKIEREILDIIQNKICNSLEIEKLVKTAIDKYKEMFLGCDEEIKNTREQLNTITKTVQNYCNAIGQGFCSDTLKSDLYDAEKTKELLTQKLAGLTSMKSNGDIKDVEEIADIIKGSFKGFSKKAKIEQKEMLKQCIKEIKITPDCAEITFTLDSKTTYFQLAEKEDIQLKIRIDINNIACSRILLEYS